MGIMTVNGVVRKEDLGITTPHEHALIDISNQYPGDRTPGSVGWDGKVSPAYYDLLMRDPYALRDNLILDDKDLAVREIARFASAGGQTFVDVTLADIGRDAAFLRRLSRETGLNVVAGCGYYTADAHPAYLKNLRVDEIAARMVRELTVGIDGTDVKAGIIGEIGTSTEIDGEEIRVLEAAALAHKATGAPVMVHLSPWAQHGLFVVDLLERAGVDPARVCICHTDVLLDEKDMAAIMDRGAYVEFDNCGKEFLAKNAYGTFPTDEKRTDVFCDLVAQGYTERLLASCDVCLKNSLTVNGGPGYAHVLTGISDLIRRKRDDAEEVLHTVLVQNPADYLDNPLLG